MADESRVTVRMRLIGASVMARDAKRAAGGLRSVGREGARAHRVSTALSRSGGKVSSGLKAAAGSAVALGAAYLGLHGARTAIDNTEELAKAALGLHKSFGLTVSQASRFAAIFKARGVDPRQMNMGFSTLSSNLVKARGGAKASIATFKALGLSQRDVSKDGLDFNAIIMRIADGLHGHERDFRAAAAARTLFGRGFQTMVPLLRGGSAALQENLRQADKYGVTLNRKTIGPVMELVQSQRELKVAGLGLQVQLSRLLIPSLLKLEHAGERVLAVFNRKDLTLGQKITKTGGIIAPMVRKISRSGPEIQRAVTTIVEAAAPAIAKSAGMLGVAVIKGLWHSVTDPKSGLFTRAILLAFIAKKLGLFGVAGQLAGQAFRRRFGAPLPTPTPTPTGGGPAPVPVPRGGGRVPGGLRPVGEGGLWATIAATVAASLIPPNARGPGNMPIGGTDDVTHSPAFAESNRRLKQAAGIWFPNLGKSLGKMSGLADNTKPGFIRVGSALIRTSGALQGTVTNLNAGLSPKVRQLTRKIAHIINTVDVSALADFPGTPPPTTKPRTKRATPRASGRKGKPNPQAKFAPMIVHVHNTVDAKGLHTAVWHRERKIAEAR